MNPPSEIIKNENKKDENNQTQIKKNESIPNSHLKANTDPLP
jgi:hypothetical protein